MAPRTKRVNPSAATIVPPIDIKAGPNGCAEASTLSRDRYIPCNRPAKFVVGWTGRSEAPIRMCEMCADHNVKNRGGFIAQPYVPSATRSVAPDDGQGSVQLAPGNAGSNPAVAGQPLPLGNNVTDDALIAENHKLEDEIKAGLAKFTEWAKPRKDRLKAIEDDLFKRLVERGADSTKTDSGTAYISNIASVKVDNSEQLFDFAADNWEAYGDEVKVVISKAGVDKFMEDNNGQLPPGISLSKYSKLNIRRS
jgi:hypothetical protein